MFVFSPPLLPLLSLLTKDDVEEDSQPKRNIIASLYLDELRDYYEKYNILKKPNFNYKFSLNKKYKKLSSKSIHAFYRLNLFINKDKVNQLKLLEQFNQKKIDCGVGSCPEIYREKVFKKFKLYPKKRLTNAKLLGETSITFPIDANRKLTKVKREILLIKRIFNKYI